MIGPRKSPGVHHSKGDKGDVQPEAMTENEQDDK